MRCIAFANLKGGCGKTTVCFNLVLGVLERRKPQNGKKYVYIEFDMGAGGGTVLWNPFFPLNSAPTLKDYLAGKAGLEDVIFLCDRYDEYGYFAFIPGGKIGPEDFGVLNSSHEAIDKLDALISFLEKKCELAFVDCPGEAGFSGLKDYYFFLLIADEVILVADPRIDSVKALDNLIDIALLYEIRVPFLVLNKFNVRSRRHREIMDYAVKKLGLRELGAKIVTIHADKKVEESWSLMPPEPTFYFDRKTSFSRDILRLADLVLGKPVKGRLKPSQKIGLLWKEVRKKLRVKWRKNRTREKYFDLDLDFGEIEGKYEVQ